MDTKDNRLPDKVDDAVGDCHDDTALLRRIDWRILPVMFLTYFLQFVDKISLNVGFASPFFSPITACRWSARCANCVMNDGSTPM